MANKIYKSHYICPGCQKKQNTVIQWSTVSVADEIDLKTEEAEEVDKVAGDHESFNCPECKHEIPNDMILK